MDKAGNDITKKTKYIDESKKIQEKFDYQNSKAIELESELNEKNKNINTLKNNIKENLKIMTISNKYHEEIDKLKKLNNTHN